MELQHSLATKSLYFVFIKSRFFAASVPAHVMTASLICRSNQCKVLFQPAATRRHPSIIVLYCHPDHMIPTLLNELNGCRQPTLQNYTRQTLMQQDTAPESPSKLDEWPTFLDEEQSNVGAEVFFNLEKRVRNLDKELCEIPTAVSQLGGSVAIYSSAFRLRERLMKILFLFRENAALLYPRKIERKPPGVLRRPNLMDKRRRVAYRGQLGRIAGLTSEESLRLDILPDQFECFAEDILTLLDSLNEFPEFTNEAINQLMEEFDADLMYWASCLYGCKSQFRCQGVQRYIHDLIPEFGDHIDNITGTLSMFVKIGIPTIRSHQQHDASNTLNMSTLATFFSAVTASMLQTSYNQTGHVLGDCVNAFWFSSLVLSIAAALNSLLKLTWQQAVYRSPRSRVPWWVLVWIKRSPLVCLVMSVVCFSAGLVLFTYSSRQARVTSTITTILMGITSLGLVSGTVWFASERLVFIRHKGQKLLAEAISEVTHCLGDTLIARAIRAPLEWCIVHTADARAYFRSPDQSMDLLPIVEPPQSDHSRPPPYDPGRTAFVPKSEATFSARPIPTENVSRIARQPEEGIESHDPGVSLHGVKLSGAISKLRSLEVSQELDVHEAIVEHLQFSPNGKYLATLSWDKTSVIFRVGKNLTTHRVLAHDRGFIHQVAWSPDGRILLARLTSGVKVWSEDSMHRRTIDRQNKVQLILWLPTGDAFLSVEGNDVIKLNLLGQVLDSYHFGHIRLTNVVVTPDSSRLIGAGPSITLPSGPQPSRHTRVEKLIIVYNMQTRRKESQIPFAGDIRDIVMARKTPVILISLEKDPPQLWKLGGEQDNDAPEYAQTAQMIWKHTFPLKDTVEAVEPCQFGGKDDHFVFCAGKAGDVYIWDRDTAAPLHHIRPKDDPDIGELASIAWNSATDDPMMFATGYQDGAIRVYSTPWPEGKPDELKMEKRSESAGEMKSSVHSDG